MAAMALFAASFSRAQDAPAASLPMPRTVEDVLHGMSDQADVIFLGEVIVVRAHEDEGVASGCVEVDFRVDRAIRGVSGDTYTLREWAGLWSGNARRYQPGERLLMLLHAPGISGLSSPVDGTDGAIPIRGGTAVAVLDNAAAASSPSPVVDLRWLGAKLPQSASFSISPVLPLTQLGVSQQAAEGSTPNLLVAGEDTSSRASIPTQKASVDAVTKLLASWQKAAADVR
jgi:hypothetical protein